MVCFYVTKREEEETKLELVASYGAENANELKQEFDLREGLIGQAAADKRSILLKDVPPDFLRIGSGMGDAASRQTSTFCRRFSRTR
jgi:signal transduction protein with GAF and PtsI domain